MKPYQHLNIWSGVLVGTLMVGGTALANPSMLPGHPMKAMKDPVNVQALANDTGRNFGQGTRQ